MNVNLNEIKRILIIQYQPFGDVLLNTGYLPFLREKFKDAKIDFLVREPYQKAISENPWLDELVTFKNGEGFNYFVKRLQLIKKIRNRKYDLIIDQIRNTGSAQITLFSGAKYKLGFINQRWRSIYNLRPKRGPLRYYSAMKFDTLAPLGITEQPHKVFFSINEDSNSYVDNWINESGLQKDKLICFSPGSPIKLKKWSVESYARLADYFQKNGAYKVVLMWAPNEKKDVEYVASLMQTKPYIAPATTFNQAAAMLKRCKLLVCNDGGLNHLSVATETPSIAFFGKHKPERWNPEIFKGHIAFYNEESNPERDATLGIEVEDVFNKATTLLKNMEGVEQGFSRVL